MKKAISSAFVLAGFAGCVLSLISTPDPGQVNIRVAMVVVSALIMLISLMLRFTFDKEDYETVIGAHRYRLATAMHKLMSMDIKDHVAGFDAVRREPEEREPILREGVSYALEYAAWGCLLLILAAGAVSILLGT